MQGNIDELKRKKEQLMELKKKIIEGKCKSPQDASVEVKRTPSLAALCQCTPETKLLVKPQCYYKFLYVNKIRFHSRINKYQRTHLHI